MSFDVGQQVICVDAEPRPETTNPEVLRTIRKYGVYIVQRVHQVNQIPFITVIGAGCIADRFRPIRKTDIDVFTRMLKEVPLHKELTDDAGNIR